MEEEVVLIKLTAYLLRTAEVLNRGEEDVAAALHEVLFKCLEAVFIVAGAKAIVLAVVEDLFKVFEPSHADNGAMGDDQRAPEIPLFGHLEGGERLAEAHFGVPEHALTRLLEALYSALDGVLLFGAEDDGRAICAADRHCPISRLDGANGALDCLQIATEPFLRLGADAVERLLLDARSLKDTVDVVVAEGAGLVVFVFVEGDLSVEQLVDYAGCASVLVDAFSGGLIQRFAVGGRPIFSIALVTIEGSVAHLQTACVWLVGDSEDVDQLCL